MDYQPVEAIGLPQRSAKVALLVDGDNVAADWAGQLLVRAGRLGQVVIKRVYCDPYHFKNWESSSGFGIQVARTGSNAADMLLTIDAVDFSHREDLTAMVIASSDGGFAPLARHLVERGLTIIGLGPATAPLDWRKSCTRFEALARPVANGATSESVEQTSKLVPASPTVVCEAVQASGTEEEKAASLRGTEDMTEQTERLNRLVQDVLGVVGSPGMLLSALGDRMSRSGIKKSDLPERSWQKYFAARSDHFLLDPISGPGARVSLIGR